MHKPCQNNKTKLTVTISLYIKRIVKRIQTSRALANKPKVRRSIASLFDKLHGKQQKHLLYSCNMREKAHNGFRSKTKNTRSARMISHHNAILKVCISYYEACIMSVRSVYNATH